jgi:hypothetical protein
MDESLAFSSMNQAEYMTVCACGRSFAQLNAYANHQRTCKKRKKHLSNALTKAKEVWTARKKVRREDEHDKLIGFIPPPTFNHNTATQTSPAGESGIRPQLDEDFSGLEFSSEQATIDGMEYSGNLGPGSDLPRVAIEVEENVSVRVNSNSIPYH